MTAVLDRVPVERIGDRAARMRPGEVALGAVLAVLFGAGWLAFKVIAGAWAVIAWCASAVIEGWQSARAGQRARAA